MAKRKNREVITEDERGSAMFNATNAYMPLPSVIYGRGAMSVGGATDIFRNKDGEKGVVRKRLTKKILKTEALEPSGGVEAMESKGLDILGALDEADSQNLLTPQEKSLAKRLRAKLAPVVKADLENSPLNLDLKDLIPMAAMLGGGATAMTAGKLTKNDNIVDFARAVAKAENIPVRNIAKTNEGLLGLMFGTGPHYNAATKSILTTPSEAIALHELGHAKDYANVGLAREIVETSLDDIPVVGDIASRNLPGGLSGLPIVPALAVAPLLSNRVREALKGDDKTSLRSKVVTGVEDNPWTIGVAASTPVLRSEAVASKFALKQLAKARGFGGVMRGLAALAPALGTYAAGAGLAGLTTQKIVKYQDKMQAAREEGAKNLAALKK